jgi:hypothetical protein
MSRLFYLAIALVATAIVSESNTTAQIFDQGYQFGAGYQAAGMGWCGGFYRPTPREQPPYFAQFPPVYYSHVVPRPYGISPYAAPPGIAPVEMSVPVILPNPVSIKNPYYKGEVRTNLPAIKPTVEEKKEAQGSKTTRHKKSANPYYFPAVEVAGG